MKYVVDLDALKNCLDLLPKPVRNGNLEYVCLQAVKEMIDKFPKDDYCHEYKESLNVWDNCSEKMSKTSRDILSGKGLSKI